MRRVGQNPQGEFTKNKRDTNSRNKQGVHFIKNKEIDPRGDLTLEEVPSPYYPR